eukprot:2004937-Prymnesium_polylepis.1
MAHLPHEGVRLGAPLHLDERRHVAAGAVLRLERAAVLECHVLADVVHEALVAAQLRLVLEGLVEDEVEVALKRVAHQARVGVVICEGPPSWHVMGT